MEMGGATAGGCNAGSFAAAETNVPLCQESEQQVAFIRLLASANGAAVRCGVA